MALDLTANQSNSIHAVDRLQGTDGIRREVALSSAARVASLTPLQAYLERGLITEQFLELYCYCHVAMLIEAGEVRRGEEIIVGYDPRDLGRRFIDPVLSGVRKAGAVAVDVGVLPTPAVALYMLASAAAGAIVVTASHNGPDQNGIKVFLRTQGLKLFPADDRRLTRAVLSTSYNDLAALPEVGAYREEHDSAVELFRAFCLDPRNSWLDDAARFSSLRLVIDCANGALSELAAPIFQELGAEVIPVNTSLRGDVNFNSGVADLEGTVVITSDMVHDATGRFAKHEALRLLFAEGRAHRVEARRGALRLAAAVFDADADRFYCVEYDAFEDRLLVLSGDEIACHQASYLCRRHPAAFRGALFVNTVESDLNVSSHAASLGLTTSQTAVGDKWVLLRAVRAMLQAQAFAGDLEKVDAEVADLCRRADELITDPEVNGARFGKLFERLAERLGENSIAAALLQPGGISFAVGCEETGHCMSTGYLRRLDGREAPVFLGNGLKSAINTFVATQSLLEGLAPREHAARLAHPFTPGHKRTFYAYYTRKADFSRGAPIWEKLERTLRGILAERLNAPGGGSYTLRSLHFTEDPDMLYLGAFDADERLCAGVFVRNSGTEEKTGVNVRGGAELAEGLNEAGEAALRVLLTGLKDPAHPYAKAERRILERLAQAPCSENELLAFLDQLGDKVNIQRLFDEVVKKQQLVQRTQEGYKLTACGAWYVDKLHAK